jgi:hypothetical protein
MEWAMRGYENSCRRFREIAPLSYETSFCRFREIASLSANPRPSH